MSPSGVWATVLLDVARDGTVRWDCIEEQAAALARAGVDGIYCCGTAGEFHVLDEAGFARAAEATAEAARRHALPFQIGAAHPMPLDGLARVRRAEALRPSAIQVILPDWAPLDADGARRFLGACAEAARGVPLVLYHPPHGRSPLSPDALAGLADLGVVGLKTGGGDAAWFAEMAPALERLSVFVPGHAYASGVLAGAHGAYSNMACLSPGGAVRWARQVRADPDAALATEARIARFTARAIEPRIAAGLPGYACDKLMAVAGGWCRIAPRLLWPYAGADDAAVEAVRAAARDVLPDFPMPEVTA